MNEIEVEDKKLKSQKKTNSKPKSAKTREDVVLNAIPHVVEALTAIVLHSKCEDFKKKCQKIFKVDDPNSIKACLEAKLWNITEMKLGITQPKDSKELQQKGKELQKDYFEDLEFISQTDLASFSKEESIRSQLGQDRVKNVCNTTPIFLSPMKNENRNSHSLNKTLCSLSAGSEYDDLHWDINDNILESCVSEPSQDNAFNKNHRMSDLSVPAPHNLNNLSQENLKFNKFDETKESETNSLQLTCNKSTELALNPAHNQTMMENEVKSLHQLHNSWTTLKAISHDRDWLDNYEHDNFWMDHNGTETNQTGRKETRCQHWKILDSSNLIQISNAVADLRTVTKEATSYCNSFQGSEFLEPRNTKDNCNPKDITPMSSEDRHHTCMLASCNCQQIGKVEERNLEVQAFYNRKQNEIFSNDCNFEELANFS